MTRIRRVRRPLARYRALMAIFEQAVAVWLRAVDRLTEAYAERPSGSGFRDSQEKVDRVLSLLAVETEGVLARINLQMNRWAAETEEAHRVAWAEGVLAATGIQIATVLSPVDVRETVAASVQRSAALIRNVSEGARARVADIVFRGVQQRTPTRDVAKAIREALDIERRRALNIASDQTTKLYAALDRARQQEAGLSYYRWRHSGKKHPRPAHVARDGQLFVWEGEGDKVARAAVPAGDAPGEPPYCGCTAEPVLVIDGEVA